MKGCLTTEPISAGGGGAAGRQRQGVMGMDYVREVTPAAAYDWDPEDRESRRWTIVKGDRRGRDSARDREKFSRSCRRCSIASSPTTSA